MVNKSGDQISRIIAVLLVVIVVVFVVVMVREGQRSSPVPSASTPQEQSSPVAPRNASEMLLTVQTPGVETPGVKEDKTYYLPQDVNMQVVSDMVVNPDGGVTLTLTNGQKLVVSSTEMNQIDPQIRMYAQYTLEKGTP